MKAAMMREWGSIQIEDVDMPKIGPEEALIKVVYAGICGSDLHVFKGNHPTAKLPLIMGHEFSGELVDINTKLPIDINIGDKVVAQPYYGCGVCDACIQSRGNICLNLKLSGIHCNGCFAQYVKVPANKVYKIPDNFDMKLAALAEPLAVAVHDIRRSELKIGERVLVMGGGPIGVLIALVARLNGAGETVISEINENRIKFIEELGFKVINPLKEDFLEKTYEYTNNGGFDKVFEVTGVGPSVKMVTKVCKVGGTVVLTGMPKESLLLDVLEGVMKELDFKGVRIHSQINFKGAVDLLKSGTINEELSKVITDEYDLDNIKEAIDFSFKDDKHFKVLLKI